MDYIKSDEKKYEYRELRDLYIKIKEGYREKIKENEIDIKIEKIQLKKRLGKYRGKNTEFNFTLISIVISTILTLSIEPYVGQIFGKNFYLSIFVWAAFYIIFIKLIGPVFISDKNEELVYNISLIVLDELETEKNSE